MWERSLTKSNNKWNAARSAADNDDVNANVDVPAAADGNGDNDVNAAAAEVADEI